MSIGIKKIILTAIRKLKSICCKSSIDKSKERDTKSIEDSHISKKEKEIQIICEIRRGTYGFRKCYLKLIKKNNLWHYESDEIYTSGPIGGFCAKVEIYEDERYKYFDLYHALMTIRIKLENKDVINKINDLLLELQDNSSKIY